MASERTRQRSAARVGAVRVSYAPAGETLEAILRRYFSALGRR